MPDSTSPPTPLPQPSLLPAPPPLENPYQPPAAPVHPSGHTGAAESDSKNLVLPIGWQSPPICIFTGETEDLLPARTQVLSWVNPWLAILIVFGLIPYVLIAALTQKKGAIVYYVSRERAARNKKRKMIVYGLFIAGLVTFIYGGASEQTALIGIGMLAFMTGLVLATTFIRFFAVKRIDNFTIRLAKIPLDVRQKIVQADRASRGL
ncbi:MAG: hypothetical protein JWL81_1812 [Verrucomicrobiales bacterium]|nr:hypothetical protein [Verrucomicrobiales bacterium]